MMSMFRLLQDEAKKKETYYDTIDYTVLSVAVATLGLILVVEIARHKIDHLAQGRPFFQTVLASVNSECAYQNERDLPCSCILLDTESHTPYTSTLFVLQWRHLVLSSLSYS